MQAQQYQLSGPYTHANLTVFLLHAPDTLPDKTYLTLQEALEQKLVVVHETGNVSALAIENLSPTDEVYLQAGDIVKGGQQDRVLHAQSLSQAGSTHRRKCTVHRHWPTRAGISRGIA